MTADNSKGQKILMALVVIMIIMQVATVLYVRKKFNDNWTIIRAFDDSMEERILSTLEHRLKVETKGSPDVNSH